MEKITLYFTPTQFSRVTGIPLKQIFVKIRQGSIPHQMTDKGIRIPVTYKMDT